MGWDVSIDSNRNSSCIILRLRVSLPHKKHIIIWMNLKIMNGKKTSLIQEKCLGNTMLAGGFKYFSFSSLFGEDPIWLIFFRWVETTNQHDFPFIFLPFSMAPFKKPQPRGQPALEWLDGYSATKGGASMGNFWPSREGLLIWWVRTTPQPFQPLVSLSKTLFNPSFWRGVC